MGNKFDVKGTNTIDFVSKNDLPINKDLTYATFVFDGKSLKSEVYPVRMTVKGERLSCPDEMGSPTANILETKILANSTMSHAKYGARFLSVDILNDFLATPMVRPEYKHVEFNYLVAYVMTT